MSFFARKNKLKRQLNGDKLPKKRRKEVVKSSKKQPPEQVKKVNGDLDENISSDSELSDVGNKKYQDSSSDEEEETAQEKRLRLAKQYLEEIEKQEKERAEDEEIDHDVIAHRLKEDVAEQSGKLHRKVADNMQLVTHDAFILRGHQRSITCVIVSPDNQFIYSGSKDCMIIKWSVANRKKVKVIPRGSKKNTNVKAHSAHVLCLAISSDNKFLASGCQNKIIHIWNPDTLEHIHTFTGHRDSVMGLAFRKNTHQLFSASSDRSVKIWNLDEMAYVETLFGHQDVITSIDSLVRDRAITSGSRDNSLRIWKIVEESQLVFNGHIGLIDCVRFINEEYFVSCGDDGMIAVWGILKKKPLITLPAAHGVNHENNQPNWVISVASFQYTDVVASGSSDGHVKLWKCGENFRNVTEFASFPVVGHINSLQFASDGSFLAAAVGQEHRLGRWSCIKKAHNILKVIPLNINER